MEIAAHHPEGQRIAPGIDVKKGLLFDWVALDTGDVAEGHPQLAGPVKPHPADASPPWSEQAPVAARHTPDALAFNATKRTDRSLPVKRFCERLVDDVRAGWQGQAGPGFILRGYGLHSARKGA
jgi:hypothetical protein